MPVSPEDILATNRQRLIQFFKQGEKLRGTCKIGLELEQFIIDEDTGLTVTYESGLKTLLEEMGDMYAHPDDTPLIIDDQLMGYIGSISPFECAQFFYDDTIADIQADTLLSDVECEEILESITEARGNHLASLDQNKRIPVSITLEPASQLEISVGPCETVEDCLAALIAFSQQLSALFGKLNKHWVVIHLGYNPIADARELPLINKERYRLMDEWFASSGKHGIDMMRGSASTQVSIDYTSEAQCIRRYRLAVALGPLFALMFDNGSADHVPALCHAKRMVRSHIWRSTDPVRCGIVPTTFDADFGYESYADWILSLPAILVTTADDKTVSAHNKTFTELMSEREMSKHDIEHALSMGFPDCRLKNFIEIRDVDSLPIHLAVAYAALIKGIFYHEDAMSALEARLGMNDMTCETVICAREALMEHGYKAHIYGDQDAGELCDFIVAQAYQAYPADDPDRELLEPIHDLVKDRLTNYEDFWAEPTPRILSAQYRRIIEQLGGDLEGQKRAQDYLDHSFAQRNGKTAPWTFTPKLYTPTDVIRLRSIAERTWSIMDRVTEAYLTDPHVREAFGFDEFLEDLTLITSGYSPHIPLARVDIFYDEETGDFKFCELNTDGSSGVVFATETNEAIKRTASFEQFSLGEDLSEFAIVERWSQALLDCYRKFAITSYKPERPSCIALVDYRESVMYGETQLYAKYIKETFGIETRFVDIRDLAYKDDQLIDTTDGTQIDCVWRRAVTSEMLTKMCEGSEALITAARSKSACMIGSFKTHPAGVKDLLPLLTGELGRVLLNEEDYQFMVEHTPHTALLTPEIPLAAYLNQKDNYIVKTRDGYGGSGVIAGSDCTDAEWESLLKEKAADKTCVIQEYITPYKTRELVPCSASDAENSEEPYNYYEFDNLVGLYVFNGSFAGIYSRAGRKRTITAATDSFVLPTFIVEEYED